MSEVVYCKLSQVHHRIQKEVATSKFGVYVPTVTGFLSATCSFIIFYLILRSPTRLSSSYNRILFCMSVFDIIASISMGITTLPMPRDNEIVDSYGFEGGVRLGNLNTCTVQGVLRLFGQVGVYSYNLMLCIYYLLSLGFMVEKKKVVKFFEPISHILILTSAFVVISLPIPSRNYNASFYEPWCTVYVLKDTDCHVYRGNLDALNNFLNIISGIIIFDVAISFICLFIITLLVWIRLRRINHVTGSRNDVVNRDQEDSTSDFPESVLLVSKDFKVVLVHSICYYTALIITLLFPSLFFILDMKHVPVHYVKVMKQMALVFEPSQGIFNLLIFMGNKIVLMKSSDPLLTTCQAIVQIFCMPQEDPLIMTNISMAIRDIEQRRLASTGAPRDDALVDEHEVLDTSNIEIIRRSQINRDAQSFESITFTNHDREEVVVEQKQESDQESLVLPSVSLSSTNNGDQSLGGFSVSSHSAGNSVNDHSGGGNQRSIAHRGILNPYFLSSTIIEEEDSSC